MEARAATAGMVATLRLRQLQDDVCDSEQAELRRLEGGVTDSDDSETDSDDSEEGQLVPERVEEGADRSDDLVRLILHLSLPLKQCKHI